MKIPRLLVILLGFAIVLAGIGVYVEQTDYLNRPASVTVPTGTAFPSPTAELAAASPTAGPVDATPAAEADESCVACHTDQAVLQAMAQDEPVTESLSSGEG